MREMDNGQDFRETIARIRHEFTNYDKLAVFYHVLPHYRTQLNGIISALIKNKMSIPEFREKVKQIENLVNLNLKKNQKSYIRTFSRKFREMGYYTDDTAKQLAKTNLGSVLKAQSTMNSGVYDPNLFSLKFTPLRNKFRN